LDLEEIADTSSKREDYVVKKRDGKPTVSKAPTQGKTILKMDVQEPLPSTARMRQMTGERRQSFWDEHGWPPNFETFKPDEIDDLAAVISACRATVRLFETIEWEACENRDFARQLRKAIETPTEFMPGHIFSASAIVTLLTAVASEANKFASLAVKLRRVVSSSILGRKFSEEH
jgi:hypothetical protein